MDLALNNLQWLMCHKTKPNQTVWSFTAQYFNWIHLWSPSYSDDLLTFKKIYLSMVCNLSVDLNQFWLVGWLVGFYGISTFVGYLTPNPFLCKSVLFKTILFSISTQFNCQKHFYFKLFKQLYIIIHFSMSTVSMSKIVQFKTIQLSISTQYKCKESLIVKNISISNYSSSYI